MIFNPVYGGSSAPNLGSKTITANGTYLASADNLDGYDEVTANVPNTYAAADEGKVVNNGALTAQTSRSVTTNGTYDTTLNNEVVVNVSGASPTLITKNITENGTYDAEDDNADGYSSVIVDVQGGGGSTNILSGTTTPTSGVGSDGDVYLQYVTSEVPTGYTQLDYLEVTTQGPYIDSGVQFSTIDGFDVDFEITASLSNNNGVYGYNYSGVELCINYWNQLYAAVDRGSVGITPVIGRHKVEARASSLTIDGTLKSYTPRWDRAPSKNAYVFAFNNNTTPYKTQNTRIYSVVHYNGTSVVQKLVPAKRNSDDVLGLYDVTNDSFLTNSGTGSFAAGAEYSGEPISDAFAKVSGAWQDLIGTDIDDINTGGGGGSTLITKTITENGVYDALSDNADGYSEVTVDVPAVNENLLCNWDFNNVVNTRGNSQYTSGYGVDGWSVWRGTVRPVTGGISLQYNSSYDFMLSGQFLLQAQAVQSLFGKTITISALVDDQFGSYTFTASSSGAQDQGHLTVNGIDFYFYRDSSSQMPFYMLTNSSDNDAKVIRAVKAEFGNTQTLATQINGVWTLNKSQTANEEYFRVRAMVRNS